MDIKEPSRSYLHYTDPLVEAMILYAVFFLPGLLPSPHKPDPLWFNAYAYHIQIIGISIPQTLLLLYCIRKNHPAPHEEYGIRTLRAKDLIHGIGVFMGAFTVMLITGYFALLLPESMRVSIMGTFSWKLNDPWMIPMVILTSFIIGYREELFFRSYLHMTFGRADIPFIPTALISSFLFSVGHIYEGIIAVVLTFFLGFFFSLVLRKTGSVHGVAIGHGLYNIMALLLSLTRTG